MATITQDMQYRLSLIKYAERFWVTKAAIKFKTNRQYIYRRKRRYDGSIESSRDHSRRPHHHPNQHTPKRLKLDSSVSRKLWQSSDQSQVYSEALRAKWIIRTNTYRSM